MIAVENDVLLPIPEHLQGHGMVGCLEIVRPDIENARARVRKAAGELTRRYPDAPFDGTTAEEALAGGLAELLLTMMSRVMVLELNVARLEGVLSGETAEERFSNFVERMQNPEIGRALLDEYKVLLQQIATRLNQWAAFSLEFLEHLCRDWPQIRGSLTSQDPGFLVSARMGAGDTHRNGRSVIIASFSGGERLVYKPRSFAVDKHFQELLAWLNEQSAGPEFRLLKVLDGGDHGWSEFIGIEPCASDDEVRRFYQRQGGYIALLYALEASDFHCENLIACGEHPMLIDLEALFQARMEQDSSQRADYLAGNMLAYSVLRVGLLPLRYWATEENSGVDMSGLGSAAGQLTPRPVPCWENGDTDQMRLIKLRVEMEEAGNRPIRDGREVNAFDHPEAIADGFSSMYRTLLRRREEFEHRIRRFARDEVRAILRPTQAYGSLLHESFHPDVLREEADRNALFERLASAVQDTPALERAVPMEIADLWRGDIPVFSTRPDSRHLWSSTNERVEDFFTETGLALAERRIAQLSEQDLERQLWIVKASIATLGVHTEGPLGATPRPPEPATEVSPRELIQAARAIGDRLEELALSGDDDASWVGLSPFREREWRLAPLGLDLYDGLAGMVLFLARLHEICGETRYEHLAGRVLHTLKRQIAESEWSGTTIGGFNGWGGVIYCLSHLGVIWRDTALFAEAGRIARSIDAMIEADTHLDVIGGAAGLILSLASLYQCGGSEEILRTAVHCGEHLARTAQRQEHGIGWVDTNLAPVPLTGFAHGNAGIAYALLELSSMSGDERYRSVAWEAMKYERALCAVKRGNWPDLRAHRTNEFVTAWCHGAPGIGLGRMLSMRHIQGAVLQFEIRMALETTLAEGFGGNHTLCHGDVGNAEILMLGAAALDEPEWRTRANRIAANVLSEAAETGWVCGNPMGLESPGFMTGLAGIGYGLLRLAAPNRVPSVLALAPPLLP